MDEQAYMLHVVGRSRYGFERFHDTQMKGDMEKHIFTFLDTKDISAASWTPHRIGHLASNSFGTPFFHQTGEIFFSDHPASSGVDRDTRPPWSGRRGGGRPTAVEARGDVGRAPATVQVMQQDPIKAQFMQPLGRTKRTCNWMELLGTLRHAKFGRRMA